MVGQKTAGNLPKGENINIRVSPKLKFGLELLARKQRRTLTSVVEWAIDKMIRDQKEGLCYSTGLIADSNTVLGSKPNCYLDDIWNPDEITRFFNLVYFDRSLLTFEEETTWKFIADHGYFWERDSFKDQSMYVWNPDERANLRLDKVRKCWAAISEIIEKAQTPACFIPIQRDLDGKKAAPTPKGNEEALDKEVSKYLGTPKQ